MCYFNNISLQTTYAKKRTERDCVSFVYLGSTSCGENSFFDLKAASETTALLLINAIISYLLYVNLCVFFLRLLAKTVPPPPSILFFS